MKVTWNFRKHHSPFVWNVPSVPVIWQPHWYKHVVGNSLKLPPCYCATSLQWLHWLQMKSIKDLLYIMIRLFRWSYVYFETRSKFSENTGRRCSDYIFFNLPASATTCLTCLSTLNYSVQFCYSQFVVQCYRSHIHIRCHSCGKGYPPVTKKSTGWRPSSPSSIVCLMAVMQYVYCAIWCMCYTLIFLNHWRVSMVFADGLVPMWHIGNHHNDVGRSERPKGPLTWCCFT